jgi:hypothetical protein
MPPEALALIQSITPEMFAGTPREEEYQRLAPNPGDFPALVEKMRQFLTAPYAWTDEAIRAIEAPILFVVGDSEGVRLEHMLEMFRLRSGAEFGDLAGLPESQFAVLPGTTHMVPPGSGLLDRADWLLAMIQPFLDTTSPAARRRRA